MEVSAKNDLIVELKKVCNAYKKVYYENNKNDEKSGLERSFSLCENDCGSALSMYENQKVSIQEVSDCRCRGLYNIFTDIDELCSEYTGRVSESGNKYAKNKKSSRYNEYDDMVNFSEKDIESYIVKKNREGIASERFEKRLLKMFKSGQKEYFVYFSKLYRPMLKKLVNGTFLYLSRNYDREDVEQVGLFGIYKGLNSYNEYKDTKISSHIYNSIKFEIMNQFRHWEQIRYPRDIKSICTKYSRLKERYDKKYNIEISFEEAAEKINVDPKLLEKYVKDYEVMSDFASLGALYNLKNDNIVNYENVEESIVNTIYVKEKLKLLNEEDYRFVKMKFLDDMSRKDVMKILDIDLDTYLKTLRRIKMKLKYILQE